MQPHAFEASLVPSRHRSNHSALTDFGQESCLCPEVALFPFQIAAGMLSCVAEAVDVALAQHNQTNGSTVSLIHSNMVGQKLYSVSPYPSRTITLWERPTREILFDFAKANLAHLLMPSHALGTWFNDYALVHCLDVVLLVRERNEAIEIGLRAGQDAIFDLGARREISIRSYSQKRRVGLDAVGDE